MTETWGGCPCKPRFGLSWAVLPLDKVFPPLVRIFSVHSEQTGPTDGVECTPERTRNLTGISTALHNKNRSSCDQQPLLSISERASSLHAQGLS